MGFVDDCGARLLHGGLQLRSNRVLMRCEAERDWSKARDLHLKFGDNVADNRVRHVVSNMISVSQSENQEQPGYFHLITSNVTGNGI